jgi:hypothetical protein
VSVTENELPFGTRLWFAWVAFFKILFDGEFAAKCYAPQLPPPEPEKKEEKKKEEPPKKVEAPKPSNDPALQLLALLQREGRLVDFLEEDIASAADDQIGAAARVVHQGCRKALREHVKLAAVRDEEEGAKVTLPEGFSAAEVKLTGNVSGKGPHEGTLRHKGWKVTEIKLPTPVDGHDARVIAQAEVEL